MYCSDHLTNYMKYPGYIVSIMAHPIFVVANCKVLKCNYIIIRNRQMLSISTTCVDKHDKPFHLPVVYMENRSRDRSCNIHGSLKVLLVVENILAIGIGSVNVDMTHKVYIVRVINGKNVMHVDRENFVLYVHMYVIYVDYEHTYLTTQIFSVL